VQEVKNDGRKKCKDNKEEVEEELKVLDELKRRCWKLKELGQYLLLYLADIISCLLGKKIIRNEEFSWSFRGCHCSFCF
jgi:hypothetical protein